MATRDWLTASPSTLYSLSPLIRQWQSEKTGRLFVHKRGIRLTYLEVFQGSVDVIQVLSSSLKVHGQEPGVVASLHEDAAKGQVCSAKSSSSRPRW